MTRLHRADAFLLVIDVQEKLMPVIDGHDGVAHNIERLVRGCKVLDVPALLTEQYVKGLGPTIAPIKTAFEETSGYEPIEKDCFSGWGCAELVTALRLLQKKQAIVADAVGSRSPSNKDVALRRMVAEGAKLSSTEMALFEMLVESGTDEFRAVSRLVK